MNTDLTIVVSQETVQIVIDPTGELLLVESSEPTEIKIVGVSGPPGADGAGFDGTYSGTVGISLTDTGDTGAVLRTIGDGSSITVESNDSSDTNGSGLYTAPGASGFAAIATAGTAYLQGNVGTTVGLSGTPTTIDASTLTANSSDGVSITDNSTTGIAITENGASVIRVEASDGTNDALVQVGGGRAVLSGTSDVAGNVGSVQVSKASIDGTNQSLLNLTNSAATLTATGTATVAGDGGTTVGENTSATTIAGSSVSAPNLTVSTSQVTGLGTAATHASTDFDASGAAATAQSTAISTAASDATTKANAAQSAAIAASAQRASNLSDLASASTARTNLGLGNAATKSTGTTAGTVAAGDDSRLSDARTPTAHASSHVATGSDALTLTEAQITGLVADLAAKAPLASPAFTGAPVAAADPTLALGLATKQYVDSVAAGLTPKPAVTALLATNTALSGLPTTDGVTLTDGQTILLTGQSTTSQNGLWVVHSGSWARPSYFATGSAQDGAYVFVSNGTVYGGSGWTEPSVITVGTSAQSWTQFSDATAINASTGLSKVGNLLSVLYGTAAGTAAQGNDSRLSNARTPTAHAASHASGGTDAITISESQVTNLTSDLGAKASKAYSVAMSIALGG